MRSSAPVGVLEVVRPSDRGATLAMRWTNRLLVAPIVAAFLQLLFFRRVPSIVWPGLLLMVALAARLLKSRMVVTERAATLGIDGVALTERFIGAPEIASVEREDAIVWVTTRSGERVELRVDRADGEHAERTVAALAAAIDARPRDVVGEKVLAGAAATSGGATAAYREPAFEAERCLSLAEDTAAAMPVRIAAAARLSAAVAADDATRTRIELVAESTASEELREELLAALDRS